MSGTAETSFARKLSQTPPTSTSPDHLQTQQNADDVQPEDNDDNEDADQKFEHEGESRSLAPLQKRRRVTRACDECRRKKIKCDGKQPCTHCTVYSYDCTYDQPSNRRRNPAPQYIEALEQRLQKAEQILRTVLPGLDIDDPKHDARNVDQIIEASRASTQRQPEPRDKDGEDAQMRSMVDRTGSLDLDDTGNWDYHGHSSGYSFMRKFRAQFGENLVPSVKPYLPENKNLANAAVSPRSVQSSPFEISLSTGADLPPKHVAIELSRNAIDDCCALQRPLHRPTFFKRLDAVYDTDPENYTDDHVRFLPLLYVVMAVGSLFGQADDEQHDLNKKGYKHAVEQGYQFFNVAKSMLNIIDCRDLTSIQAIQFMTLFLQGTAKLSTCYAYIGVALRACCRLGMHRKIAGNFNPIEQEERRRLFWQVRKMDIFVGAMLGLPQMLSNDDIDQDLPLETHDENITDTGILPLPPGAFPMNRATNAQSRLMGILQKVVRYVYPTKPPTGAAVGESYTIRHSLIRELEKDLQNWMDQLPVELRPSESADTDLARVQQLLRMSYAYIQMMIYRPFLHYVSQNCQNGQADKRSFACAAACVSVARNIVHITTEMRRRGLLMGAYWFVMYTTYFAILSLLYFVLENPESATSKDILRDAHEGRDTLASLATRSMAADRCTTSLAGMFAALPQKLQERRASLKTQPNTSRKRPPPTSENFPSGTVPLLNPFPSAGVGNVIPPSDRSRVLPSEFIARAAANRRSIPDPHSMPTPPFQHPSFSMPQALQDETMFGSPMTSAPTMSTSDFGTPSMLQGHLSDLNDVMFPGNNPFEYPNQPMSVLEDTHFRDMQGSPFGTGTPVRVSPDQFAAQPHAQPQEQFGQRPHAQQPHFEYPSWLPQSQNPTSMPQQNSFLSVNHLMSEPKQMHDLPDSMPQQEEDYWSHAPARGTFRTGLTPGGPAVNLNLDDIFGNSQGWSMGTGMGLDASQKNMNAWQQQQQQHGSSQGGQRWQ